jgi:hypothetical protein
MESNFKQQWLEAYENMQRLRPKVEQLARSAKGTYPANLAKEWRSLLVRLLNLP